MATPTTSTLPQLLIARRLDALALSLRPVPTTAFSRGGPPGQRLGRYNKVTLVLLLHVSSELPHKCTYKIANNQVDWQNTSGC